MALTLQQQLNVQRGQLKPTAVKDSLIELVHASAINYARDFSTTYKQFETVDGEGNPQNQKANSYLTKMLSASQRAFELFANVRIDKKVEYDNLPA